MDLKPYGAFLENSIRPLIEELNLLTEKVKFENVDIKEITRGLFKLHIKSVIIDAVKTIVCTGIIGFVAWTIVRL